LAFLFFVWVLVTVYKKLVHKVRRYKCPALYHLPFQSSSVGSAIRIHLPTRFGGKFHATSTLSQWFEEDQLVSSSGRMFCITIYMLVCLITHSRCMRPMSEAIQSSKKTPFKPGFSPCIFCLPAAPDRPQNSRTSQRQQMILRRLSHRHKIARPCRPLGKERPAGA
jgi:hypothetical protein